jgi:Stress responsive A/B Barrel Domain
MFVHAVYFWLKPDAKPEELSRFESKANAMLKISSVAHGWVGKPASTNRPVIDNTYTFALIVVFKDLADHDAYQVDPVHDDFRENCSMLWTKVKIYDSV